MGEHAGLKWEWMMRRLGVVLVVGVCALAGLAGSWSWLTRNPDGLNLRGLGEQAGYAYVYGYPLVLTDLTRQSALAQRDDPQINTFFHLRELPDASQRTVVRLNLDTLYSMAFLDLADGPVVLRTPDFQRRDWMFQVLDYWTNVAGAPSRRLNGSGPHSALIVGPDWQGEAPQDMEVIRVETRQAWILGRIAIAPGEDLAPIRALQDGAALSPARLVERPRPVPGAPPAYLANMDAFDVFDRMAQLLVQTEPRTALHQSLVPLGLGDDGVMDKQALGPLARWVVREGVAEARRQLLAAVLDSPYGSNNWRTLREGLGDYGEEDFGMRAGVAMVGLGANRAEDAIYPNTEIDGTGARLHGDHRYQIRFEPGALPPVDSFWSVTVYDAEGYLVDTVFSKHAINSQSDLVLDPDGGLTLSFSAAPPRAAESNWAPVPTGEHFVLTARLYSPRASALSGQWDMPPVERLD